MDPLIYSLQSPTASMLPLHHHWWKVLLKTIIYLVFTHLPTRISPLPFWSALDQYWSNPQESLAILRQYFVYYNLPTFFHHRPFVSNPCSTAGTWIFVYPLVATISCLLIPPFGPLTPRPFIRPTSFLIFPASPLCHMWSLVHRLEILDCIVAKKNPFKIYD